MLKLRFSGLILTTSGARATKCSKLLRWGLISLSFVASPMLDNCGPGREKHRKLRWYSGPTSHPAPCWARSRTTKTTENQTRQSAHIQTRPSAHIQTRQVAHIQTTQSPHIQTRQSTHHQTWESAHIETRESAHIQTRQSAHMIIYLVQPEFIWGTPEGLLEA